MDEVECLLVPDLSLTCGELIFESNAFGSGETRVNSMRLLPLANRRK